MHEVGHPPGRWWKWDLQITKQNYHLLKVSIRVLCMRMLLIISMNEHIYWRSVRLCVTDISLSLRNMKQPGVARN
jgi:hypothetical protein